MAEVRPTKYPCTPYLFFAALNVNVRPPSSVIPPSSSIHMALPGVRHAYASCRVFVDFRPVLSFRHVLKT